MPASKGDAENVVHAFGDAAHRFGSQYGMTEVGKSQYGTQCTFYAGEVIGGEIAGLISYAPCGNSFWRMMCVRSPVLIPIGQDMEQRPSPAQVWLPG